MKYLTVYFVVDILFALPIDQFVVPALLIYFSAKVLLNYADKFRYKGETNEIIH